MKVNILNARIKRSDLAEHAGRYFRDGTSEIVRALNEQGKEALVGIQREDGVYTILGKKYVYYSTASGSEGEIALAEFGDVLHENAMNSGKNANFEFVKVGEGDAVWLHEKWTMSALMNIILWLEKWG
jgi:hypothetical protein